jgi:hypothetical protein
VRALSRFIALTVAASAAAAGPAAGAQAAASSAASHRAGLPLAARAGAPGPAASPLMLANNEQFSGYDAATDSSGRSYVAWIGDSGGGRKVHLCALPPGARQCAGGVQTIDSLGSSSAQGLRVLVTPSGLVTLVWFHDTVASVNGPQGGAIAVATSHAGGPLSSAHDVATAPSFGEMLDATFGPGGAVWVVLVRAGGTTIEFRPGLGNAAVDIKAPYIVESARLAFSGSTAVLAIKKDGAISDPVSYAVHRGGAWSGFRKVAGTWTSDAEFGMTSTPSGIRLIATVSNASYFPVVSAWTGTGFSRPTLTGDRNACSPSSHDTVSDASGRLADVSIECGNVAVANLADTRHAAVLRFSGRGTFAGGLPQLTTTPRGRGWVVWSIESSVNDKLLAVPLLLPDRTVTVSASARGNRVRLRGPASCLPPINLRAAVHGSAARHWRVVGHRLTLNGHVLRSAVLHGASLTPGKRYTLAGSVTFASSGSRRTVTAKLRFRSCPNP